MSDSILVPRVVFLFPAPRKDSPYCEFFVLYQFLAYRRVTSCFVPPNSSAKKFGRQALNPADPAVNCRQVLLRVRYPSFFLGIFSQFFPVGYWFTSLEVSMSGDLLFFVETLAQFFFSYDCLGPLFLQLKSVCRFTRSLIRSRFLWLPLVTLSTVSDFLGVIVFGFAK